MRRGMTPDVVLNVVTDPADRVGGQPDIALIRIEAVDRRTHSQMAGADEFGHRQIGTVVLPRDGKHQLGMALPEFRQRLLSCGFIAAGVACAEQLSFALGRQIGPAQQGTDGKRLGVTGYRHRDPTWITAPTRLPIFG